MTGSQPFRLVIATSSSVGLSFCPNRQRTTVAFDGTGGQVDGVKANGVSKILEAEVVGFQLLRFSFDRDFDSRIWRKPGETDPGNRLNGSWKQEIQRSRNERRLWMTLFETGSSFIEACLFQFCPEAELSIIDGTSKSCFT